MKKILQSQIHRLISLLQGFHFHRLRDKRIRNPRLSLESFQIE